MSHKCEICGEEFDSKRGLHIHQGQQHDDELEEREKKENNSKSQDRITFSATQFGAATFVFGILLGLVIGGLGGATAAGMIQDSAQVAPAAPGTDNTENTGNTGNQGSDTKKIDMSKIEMKGEPVLGQKDAPVTMVVYEDFQCPFCKRFEEGAMQKIKNQYVETGKVKVVWKDMPLPSIGHNWAVAAAKTMQCVYKEGGSDAFWAVKNKVFTNQNQITASNVQSKIMEWASQEGVSKSAIQNCLNNENPMDEVTEDKREGQEIGVGGTPTAIIDGVKIVGAQPFSRFQTVIENQLGN